ncbi:MAG: iron-sulfur cluster-binding protein [Bacteroidales bacterium]|nr:iron-sulfur cluster-binding protein [Bacteroidales bacterium]
MSQQKTQFLKDTAKIAFDETHRNIIDFNISRYEKAVEAGKKQYLNLDLAKERAARIKRNVVNDLEFYLKEFEMNFSKNGGQLIWAENAAGAIKAIKNISRIHNVKHVVKSKSMITEEIELNKHLEDEGIESLETDLGEYIVQIADEKPYHIVTPAMHKSKEDIALLYNEKFDTPKDYSPEDLTLYTRKKLRKKFTHADMGITGGNFLVADKGLIALTENEGNGVLSVSFPKVHVAIVGIEKIIPSIKDLDLFWSLLSTHGTGQKITVYNSLIGGPKKDGEIDGPEHQYLILLDNGRTNLLNAEPQKVALSCIRCGACLNVCPVYKTIGGHAYNTTYSGPIGAVITPHMCGVEEYNHLSFASTLCGRCTEECPVKIPLHDLLLYNRRDAVQQGKTEKSFALMMKAYKVVMKKRWIIETLSPATKNFGISMVFNKAWGSKRSLPKFKESFAKRWNKNKL